MAVKLFIEVPCFNEEAVIENTVGKLKGVIKKLTDSGKITPDSNLVLIDDGSRDNTYSLMRRLHSEYGICVIKFSGNCGHQNAVYAGVEYCADKCDCVISIDADLQDDVNVIEEMVDKYVNGAEIVYGVRNKRESDGFFKRFTAEGFYKIMSSFDKNTVYNHADFRLLGKKAMKALLKYPERNLYLRGIVTKLGFKTDKVYYERLEREAGKTSYTFGKMLSLAWDGITSMSTKPLSVIIGSGLVILLVALAAFIYTLVSYFSGKTISGWPSLMISIWFLGGVQLLSIGVVGQYVGKTYIESKNRPRYEIEEILD